MAEDNQVNRLVAEAMLRRMGYEADVAVNRAEGIAAVCGKPYAIVPMDCLMPEMTATKPPPGSATKTVPSAASR